MNGDRKQVTISCSICRYFCRSFACEDQVLYGLAFELLMFSQSYHGIQHCPNTLSFVSTIQVDFPREFYMCKPCLSYGTDI